MTLKNDLIKYTKVPYNKVNINKIVIPKDAQFIINSILSLYDVDNSKDKPLEFEHHYNGQIELSEFLKINKSTYNKRI